MRWLLAHSSGSWHAEVYIRGKTLYIIDTEPQFGDTMRDGRRATTKLARGAGQKALDEFGQRCFGVPVSAVDDPNYHWPKKPTLVIDIDKFEPIQYPLKPPEPPKRPEQ
jgi:hypothetical protein